MIRTLRLLHEIATPGERRRFALLIVALAVAALLETASVAVVFPFVAAVANPEVVGESSPGRLLLDLLDMQPGPDVIVPLGMITLALVLSSTVVTAATTWSLFRFMYGWLHSLSSRLLLQYLRQSYAFFLGRNTSELAKNILHEVDTAVMGSVVPTMMALSRGFVALGLVTVLLILEPVIALGGMGVVGIAYVLIYLGSRGRQGQLGQRRLELNDQRYQQATEALSGIKAVKVFGQEESFLARYDWLASGYARATGSQQIVSTLPKSIVEAVGVGGGLLLVLFLLGQGRTPADVLPVVGVFAFAGYKLLPSVQQVFYSVTNVRFYRPAIERLHADIMRLPDDPDADGSGVELPSQAAVELDAVTYRYEGAAADALRDVSLTFEPGRHYGLVGRTGSGKSTTLDVALGLLRPTDGAVKVGGHVLGAAARTAWRRSVGYVPQDIFLVDTSVRQNIAFGEREEEIDEARVLAAVRSAALDEVIDGLPNGLDTEIGERGVRLSGGQRQRIGIARALYHDPDVVFFDEGTSALDGETEARVVRNLRERGKMLVMVAHRLASIEAADCIFVFDDGRVVAKGTADLLSRESDVWRSLARQDQAETHPVLSTASDSIDG